MWRPLGSLALFSFTVRTWAEVFAARGEDGAGLGVFEGGATGLGE